MDKYADLVGLYSDAEIRYLAGKRQAERLVNALREHLRESLGMPDAVAARFMDERAYLEKGPPPEAGPLRWYHDGIRTVLVLPVRATNFAFRLTIDPEGRTVRVAGGRPIRYESGDGLVGVVRDVTALVRNHLETCNYLTPEVVFLENGIAALDEVADK